MKHLIGQTLFYAYRAPFDCSYLITDKPDFFNGIKTKRKAFISKIQNEDSNDSADCIEAQGIIIDYVFLNQYNFQMTYGSESLFNSDSFNVCLKIKEPNKKNCGYFIIHDYYGIEYNKKRFCGLDGEYINPEDLRYSVTGNMRTPHVCKKLGDYLYDRYSTLEGYSFNLMIYIPFKNKKVFQHVEQSIFSCINENYHITGMIFKYLQSHDLKTYMIDGFNPHDPYKQLPKYKNKAYQYVKAYLLEFGKKRVKKMEEALINFDNMKMIG